MKIIPTWCFPYFFLFILKVESCIRLISRLCGQGGPWASDPLVPTSWVLLLQQSHCPLFVCCWEYRAPSLLGKSSAIWTTLPILRLTGVAFLLNKIAVWSKQNSPKLGSKITESAKVTVHFFSRTTTPGETKLLASEIYDILQSSSMADGDSCNEVNSRRRKAQFFLGTTNKRAKTVVLQIDGLDDTVRFKDVLHKMAREVVSLLSLQSLANIL